MLKNLSIVCLLLLGASCTHKPSRTIPAEPILQLNLDDYFSKQDSITLLAKEDLRSIYLMLQDTFTDDDEKAVLELVEKSKAQGSLNSLIKCLHETALFRHMIVRWDEPYLGTESPNWLGNFLGQKDMRPKNDILPNELFRKLFLYDQLSEESGLQVLKAFSTKPDFQFKEGDLKLQSLMVTTVHSQSRTAKFSPAGKKVALEVLNMPGGAPGFQINVRGAIYRLENEE